jgi:hypothetical protein
VTNVHTADPARPRLNITSRSGFSTGVPELRAVQ